MKELTYPEELSEEELYSSIKPVLNRRGYRDRNGSGEALYDSGEATVEVADDVLEITGPSGSEEEVIATLLEPELQD
ncbi:MAG: hypothetical protein ABEJ87_05225 [Candidatus Nanohalobium sp.]